MLIETLLDIFLRNIIFLRNDLILTRLFINKKFILQSRSELFYSRRA